MLHESVKCKEKDHAAPFKARVGIYLFLLYGLIYGGFVGINVFAPLVMEKIIFLGLNLAVVYGLGLIVFALILALIYNYICANHEKECNQ